MPDPPVTLRDVAVRAGVHPATASRALNPETRILVSEDTAQRVLDAAEALGYSPNPVARSLRTRRSHTVGVLIPDLNNPLFPPIVRGLEDRLAVDGYVALIGNTDSDDQRERMVFDQMRARHVDGLVLATARLHHPLLAEASRADLPVVLINRLAQDYSFPSVSVDNERGVRMAVAHLAGLGHRRIAYIAGPQELSTGLSRYRGFVTAMESSRLPVDDDLVVFAKSFTVEEGVRCSRRLHGHRRRQRHAGRGLLRGAGRDRAGLPGGHLRGRLQRHAVHRPAPAAADHDPFPALPGRHRGGAAAAGADRGALRAGEDPLPRPRAGRPRFHRPGADQRLSCLAIQSAL